MLTKRIERKRDGERSKKNEVRFCAKITIEKSYFVDKFHPSGRQMSTVILVVLIWSGVAGSFRTEAEPSLPPSGNIKRGKRASRSLNYYRVELNTAFDLNPER